MKKAAERDRSEQNRCSRRVGRASEMQKRSENDGIETSRVEKSRKVATRPSHGPSHFPRSLLIRIPNVLRPVICTLPDPSPASPSAVRFPISLRISSALRPLVLVFVFYRPWQLLRRNGPPIVSANSSLNSSSQRIIHSGRHHRLFRMMIRHCSLRMLA